METSFHGRNFPSIFTGGRYFSRVVSEIFSRVGPSFHGRKTENFHGWTQFFDGKKKTLTGYATHLPSGDKTFSRFQKPEKPYRILKCSKDLLTTINGKSINWTPTGYAMHLPSGDKTF